MIMSEEEMLIAHISQYMNFKIKANVFEDAVNRLARPDATQTKAFYAEALGVAVNSNNDMVHEILNVMISSDKHVNDNIALAHEGQPQLKTCLETLFKHSKGSASESQG